jgi:hypothetical protein
MDHTGELSDLSTDLLARARALREQAEAARIRSVACRTNTEAARLSGKTRRDYSAAHIRQDE